MNGAQPFAATLVALGGFAALAPAAQAADAPVVRAHGSLYPAAELAARRATSPEGFQGAYDAARDLQEALRAAGPVSRECAPLRAALGRYAAGRVLQMEGIDRPSAADERSGRRAAEGQRSRVTTSARACRGRGTARAAPPLAMSPSGGEAFFGPVVARAPAGADTAALSIDGNPTATVAVRGGRARFTVTAAPGPHDLRVAFAAGGRVSRIVRADGAVLLPATALGAAAAPEADGALAAGLTRALASGPRHRAAWVHDLSDGRSAGVGGDLAFPAASTVKLGLLAGSLVRLGAAPERSAFSYDLQAMAGFSSNLATNRLLRRLGGPATAADGLRRLGARASTFPGEYIVGTQTGPPRVSQRVTTARDLGRMLFSLHAGAVGAPGARAASGLTAHQARLAVGWLAASQQRGDNASLLAGGLVAPAPIAQKNGWIRAARHGAGIVYGPRGPAIAVVMTYDEGGVSLAQGRALGARVAALLR